MIGIYCITNTVNGKRYIGQSWDISARWLAHRKTVALGRHHNQHFKTAWDKYGESAFNFSVLKELHNNPLAQCMLDTYEEHFIRKFNTLDSKQGYNKRNAGVCGRMAEETKAKISAKEKGRISPTKGMKFSAGTRALMSKARKGKPRPDMLGRTPWNKGLKGRQVAWNKGKTMPRPPWNKGMKKNTEAD